MSFADFLVQRGYVTASQVGQATGQWSGRPDTIGAIALKLGFLSLEQIDTLLETQLQEKKLFGEIAVEKGMLSDEAVGRLLQVQKLDQSLDLGKVLVASGDLEVEKLVEALGQFLAISQPEQAPR